MSSAECLILAKRSVLTLERAASHRAQSTELVGQELHFIAPAVLGVDGTSRPPAARAVAPPLTAMLTALALRAPSAHALGSDRHAGGLGASSSPDSRCALVAGCHPTHPQGGSSWPHPSTTLVEVASAVGKAESSWRFGGRDDAFFCGGVFGGGGSLRRTRSGVAHGVATTVDAALRTEKSFNDSLELRREAPMDSLELRREAPRDRVPPKSSWEMPVVKRGSTALVEKTPPPPDDVLPPTGRVLLPPLPPKKRVSPLPPKGRVLPPPAMADILSRCAGCMRDFRPPSEARKLPVLA